MVEPSDLQDFALRVLYDFRDRGTEAELRRAISGCYYAVFHSICQAGAKAFRGPETLQHQIERSYDHSTVSAAAREVERKLRLSKLSFSETELATLARVFLRLREQRERADYDLRTTVTLEELDELIDETDRALNSLSRLAGDPDLAEFLLHPLIQRRRARG